MPLKRSSAPRSPLASALSTTSVSRARAEADAQRLELGAQLLEVVDLAVVVEHEAPVGGEHRLVARGARVDDREPPVAEPERARR